MASRKKDVSKAETSSTEDGLQDRAYSLWESAGRPDGQALDFWLAAEREIAVIAAEPAPTPKARQKRVA